MSINESIVENAALEPFLVSQSHSGQRGDQPSPRLRLTGLGYAVGHGASFAMLRKAKPNLAPGEPAAERDSFSEVSLVARLRKAIRWLTMAFPEASAFELHPGGLATIRIFQIAQFTTGNTRLS